MSQKPDHCRNCGTAIGGEYCANCGQREGRSDVRLREVAGEWFEDLSSLDSRLWRTLSALIFKPGFLSAEFNAGRKAAYIPPFRLYLVVSFVMFLLLSFTSDLEIIVGADLNSPELSAPTQQASKDYDFDIATPDSPEWLRQLEQRLENNARRAEENSADFEQRLFEYLPQMVFVLVPLLALLVQLCYLGKPYHYLQHLVFTLHLNCFMFTIAIIGILLDELAGWDLENVMLPMVFIYMPLALRRTYGDTVVMAIFKGFVILTGNGFFVITGLAGLSIVALATL